MSRTALSRIRALTFYKDSLTKSQRGDPVPQLECVGKPCRLYQPEVVRCTNIGGEGVDVDWKCEADLPESLRFGKVEVSCEGWDGPGDPYVLKGSCALQYRLVQVPDALRRLDEPRFRSRLSGWFDAAYENPSAVIFTIIWLACLLFIAYRFLKSCFSSRSGSASSSLSRPRPSGGGPGSNWFSSNHRLGYSDPPPPYTKYPTSSTSASRAGWRPGFWSGAALGGIGTYLLNRNQRERERARPATAAYDWEQERVFRPSSPSSRPSGWGFGSGRRSGFSSEDRGEGSSNLGSMRRSTGIGGSNVR
ncbi:hypothetical protein WOLCODRAFT_132447 [Wolfiporia cocos MD-104 SS10]|uniref:Store-operated calcium entry-associated regulatory factor n=1 Tax=Wolfiporia cocos (strain MD-104) TaxID=742152 RepID=A0A2H3JUL5_WOLCO|nr:hypothetical protein WOLCODRAFT_132447 [Wolfiporia cocos MD-104 SS10]